MNIHAHDSAEPTSDFAALRRTMVDCQIRTFDVTDHAVITCFLEVPREKFVPIELREVAYSDIALKIRAAKPGGEARVLLPPMILARLVQGADVKPEDKVLDIASGTGYSTAILARLAKEVVTLDSDSDFTSAIRSNLASIGLKSVPVATGSLPDGIAEAAPFDVILVNGAVEDHLDRVFGQLREGGRLITLSRATDGMGEGTCRAIRFEKVSGQISSRILFDAAAPVLSAFRHQPRFAF